jgi:hypothetical protein
MCPLKLIVVYCSGSVLSADFLNVYFRIERYNIEAVESHS